MPEKVGLKWNNITTDNEGHLIEVKVSSSQEDM
jgi:hypothetical protein